MSGTRAIPADALEHVENDFIELWGAMSSLWGVNPTMARIHGVLYITGHQMTMDDIMERLTISRGNVSMNLNKLLEWGLVRRVHRPGDRRDHYESIQDVWEMFATVAAQRKRREIDPLLNTLRRCKERLAPETVGAAVAETVQQRSRRINDLLRFLTMMDSLSQRFFESHKSFRAAVELLAGNEPIDEKPVKSPPSHG
jgi:HTH-type transcriptional regulator, glycine betaine synthesis regulator